LKPPTSVGFGRFGGLEVGSPSNQKVYVKDQFDRTNLIYFKLHTWSHGWKTRF